MSAAHELAERGFEVEVFERRLIPGGKARSMPVPNSSHNGSDPLPAEHGFRFFPGFYWHLPDTMKRIPSTGNRSAYRHLVGTTHVQIAQGDGRRDECGPARAPRGVGELLRSISFVYRFATQLGISRDDLARFVARLLVLMTSCKRRLLEQWEHEDWYGFCGADRPDASDEYKKFLAGGIVRSLVAAKADEISARTCGTVLLQMLYHLSKPLAVADRVLDGPTNDVWIDPWLKHLEDELNVVYHTGRVVEEIQCARDGYVTGVRVGYDEGRRGSEVVTGDYYVFALPVEVMAPLVPDSMKQADPLLRNLDPPHLITRWMNGVMFYLKRDVEIVRGHTVYVDSPWALTSISQKQFWDGYDFASKGRGEVEGILSVDISDWECKGSNRKIARRSTVDQVIAEVLEQLKSHLNNGAIVLLDDANIESAYLDEGIKWSSRNRASTNSDPLLINTKGSWYSRPEAATKIENVYLAADYVRTNTDLATMEAANEAARRAVNGILSRSDSDEDECEVRDLSQPFFLKAAQLADSIRFRFHKPHKFEDGELPATRGDDPDALGEELEAIRPELEQPRDAAPVGDPR